jgi:iron complex outermembrane recepter protein
VIQGTVDAQIVNVVRNAAESRAQGVEVEAVWAVTPQFKLAGSGTYLDAKYRSYPNAGPTDAQRLAGMAVQDLSGKPTLFSPKWSGTVTGTLTLPVFAGYELTTEAIGIFSSGYHLWSTIDPATRENGYARLDLRMSLDSPDSRWGLDLIAKNVTNTTIYNFAVYQPFTTGSLFRDREQYRNIALQARYKF